MAEQNVLTTENQQAGNRGKLAGGLILIAVGLGLLVFNTIEIGIYFPLALGVGFLIAGIATRSVGFLIPGGIVSGIGLGTLATAGGWFFPAGSTQSGGTFLLVFSLGWFSITLLSRLFTRETHTWALYPGGIMALIGGLIMMGEQGTSILALLGKLWPVALVGIGLAVLAGWWKERR